MTDEDDFAAVYAATYKALLAYALRRCETPEDAADVVAETFATAWRRAADMPAGDEARLWLYGVARRVLANHRRGVQRHSLKTAALRAELRPAAPAPDASPVTGVFRALPDRDRRRGGGLRRRDGRRRPVRAGLRAPAQLRQRRRADRRGGRRVRGGGQGRLRRPGGVPGGVRQGGAQRQAEHRAGVAVRRTQDHQRRLAARHRRRPGSGGGRERQVHHRP
ncbi:RNA polymerase subunit sigma-24 [Actinomadura darangshiensis]|uniref:RNA polymerase subunit sigma-24 n=1 Tax=Actinomadura darangshiensis TaxID=705336 RepID=A0A4R5C2M7_9ACTN|nr:RNA polymerase subunit sigma-24 [Actinomadura darangshiensis]